MSRDTSIRIKKEVKKKLIDLDFVKRQSENDLILHLIEFYKKHKNEIVSVSRSGKVNFRRKRK